MRNLLEGMNCELSSVSEVQLLKKKYHGRLTFSRVPSAPSMFFRCPVNFIGMLAFLYLTSTPFLCFPVLNKSALTCLCVYVSHREQDGASKK